jgi:ribosomal protein S26
MHSSQAGTIRVQLISDCRYPICDIRSTHDRKSKIGYRKSHIIQTGFQKIANKFTLFAHRRALSRQAYRNLGNIEHSTPNAESRSNLLSGLFLFWILTRQHPISDCRYPIYDIRSTHDRKSKIEYRKSHIIQT